MTTEKKENNGLYTFLVVLSALGVLAIIIAVGFAFFYPAMTGENRTPNLSLNRSLFMRDNQPSIDEPLPLIIDEGEEGLNQLDHRDSTSGDDPIEENPDNTASDVEGLDLENKDESTDEMVELDDSESIIDSLMNEEVQGAQGNLDIYFEEEVSEPAVSSEPVAVARREVQPAVVVEPEPRYITEYKDVYWIQVASFPNSIKADELQDLLSDKGIECTIQTRNVENTLYYRVRIGAFTTRGEADNFQDFIETIPEISDTQVYTTKVEQTRRIDS